jgi:hypothetical protein
MGSGSCDTRCGAGQMTRCRRVVGAERAYWKLPEKVWLGVIVWSAVVSSAAAQANTAIDCRSVNFGALDITAQPSTTVSRDVTLAAGEKLTVTLQTTGLTEVSVRLTSASQAPRVLLSGAAHTSATFRSQRNETFSLLFDADGATAAMFTAFCNHADKDARVTRKASRLAARHPDQLAVPFEAEFPVAQAAVLADVPAMGLVHLNGTSLASGRSPSNGAVRDASVAIWMQWRDQRYALGGPDGPLLDINAGGVNFGVNYKLMPEIMLGALTQFDAANEAVVGGPRSLSDQAWMIGATTTVQFAPGLSFDARAAWGSSEREVTAVDAGAERRLLNARLASVQSSGPWRFTPSVTFNYLEEAHQGARSVEAPPITAGTGRMDVGPEIAYRVPLQGSAFIEPKAVISRYWGFDSLSQVNADNTAHLKAEAGIIVGTSTGAQLQATGGVDSVLSDKAGDIWSGRFQLSVPLK